MDACCDLHDFARVARFVKTLALSKAGNVQAQASAASHFERGVGVLKSLPDAVLWYERAAEGGSVESQYALGIYYATGSGVADLPGQDAPPWYQRGSPAQATPWSGASCDGSAAAADGVALDPRKSAAWLRRAAEAGHVQAQIRLGACYAKGDGVARNPAQARAWLRRAADAGSVDAQYCLGNTFLQGDGVPADPAQGAAWLQRAAAAGHVHAQFNLGKCLLEGGSGVLRAPRQAVECFRRAAAAGHVPSQVALGVCYAAGTGVPEDAAQAVELFCAAAATGHAEAQFNLGCCHATGSGFGGAVDKAQAATLFRLVLAGGGALAADAAAALRALGT